MKFTGAYSSSEQHNSHEICIKIANRSGFLTQR